MAIKHVQKSTDIVDLIESLLVWQGKPVRLLPWQKNVAREMASLREPKHFCIVKGRQVGGSFLCSCLIAVWAFIYSRLTSLVISKTQSQATYIAAYARALIQASPVISQYIDEKRTRKYDLWLTNDSHLMDRTLGVSGVNLRGISLSCNPDEGIYGTLVVDEASYCEGVENVLPACINATQILCSTPRGKSKSNFFFNACESGDWRVFHVPMVMNNRISPDKIARLRKQYGPAQQKQEIDACFANAEENVFDCASIERSIDSTLPLFDANTFSFAPDKFPFRHLADPDKNYVFSFDPIFGSSEGDDSCLTIWEPLDGGHKLKIVAYCLWSGTGNDDGRNAILTDSAEQILSDILEFGKWFTPVRVSIDDTTNPWYSLMLLNRHLWPVDAIKWTQQEKERLISHLDSCLRADRLILNRDPEILAQLCDFGYNLKKCEASERKIYLNQKDDAVASCAMAAKYISGEQNQETLITLGTW